MSEKPEDSAKEIEEIRRRIAYLVSTDQISIFDKITTTKRALEIMEKSERDKEAVQ